MRSPRRADRIGEDPIEDDEPREGLVHILLFLGGCILLLIPGYFAMRWWQPDASFPEALGLVPALSMTVLSLVGLVVLAVLRTPFSAGIALLCLVIGIAVTAVGAVFTGRSDGDPALPTG